jgi:hypothetical protein
MESPAVAGKPKGVADYLRVGYSVDKFAVGDAGQANRVLLLR